MPPVPVSRLQRAVAAVVDSRRAVEAKEQALVASLNEALKLLGYTLAAVPPPSAESGRSRVRRRRGRP